MKFDLLSPYANEFAKWIGFRSAESILENQDIVRVHRSRIDPEIIKLFKENDLLRKTAKNAVQDMIAVKPVIPASLQKAADVAQTIDAIVKPGIIPLQNASDVAQTIDAIVKPVAIPVSLQKIKKITFTLPTPKLRSFFLIESSSGPVVIPPSLPASPAIRPSMPPLPPLPGSPAIRPSMPPLPRLPGSPAVPPSMPPLPPIPGSPAVPPSMPPLPPIPVGPVVPPPMPPLPPIQPVFPIGPAIRPPMNPLPLIQPDFPKSVIQPPPPLPISPAVPPPMSPLPPIQPPFSRPVVQPPQITPPPIHVTPPLVRPVTPPPMSPVPSLQPHFPNPVVQPHAIPSPTIHVNPHLQGLAPVPDPAPGFVPPAGGDPSFDPPPPGGSPPAGDPPGGGPPGGPGFPFKWISLLPLISKLAGAILPLIPPLLYEFFNREEKILQNINVNILATRTPKKYNVAFGNNKGEEMSINFEVVAGRFYRDEVIEAQDGFAYPIFKAKTLLSYIPVVRRFEWKRKIHETDCNITIDDPGNLSLQKGPISVYYPLSENEGFNIIYRDPTATSAIATALFNGRTHDYHLNAEDSEYSSFNVASMKVVEPLGRYEKERTQTASLPFDDDPKKANDYYLKVTQYNPAVSE